MNAAGTAVLLYHRIAHLPRDPHALAVRPDRFARHCEILARRCDVVPLGQADRSRRQVAITFDDGYADNAADARDILAGAGLPATFFVTAGRVGARAEAWWDRLEQVLLESDIGARTLDVEIGTRRLWADLRSAEARQRAHLALFWRLRPMRPAAIGTLLDEIERQLGVRRADRHTHRWMNLEELRVLSETEGMEIGAHTLTHPLLASLDPEEQWSEIDGCRRSLEQMLGTPVNLFSYPHGSHDAFTEVTMQLVRDAGYVGACTAVGGIARPGDDPLRMPRNVVGDWEAARFEEWLDRWLGQQ